MGGGSCGAGPTGGQQLPVVPLIPALLFAPRAADDDVIAARRVRLQLNVVHTEVALHAEPGGGGGDGHVVGGGGVRVGVEGGCGVGGVGGTHL